MLNSKENDASSESNTSSEGRRQHVGVHLPPGSVSLADVVHKDVRSIKTASEVRRVIRSIVEETIKDKSKLEVVGLTREVLFKCNTGEGQEIKKQYWIIG